MNFILFKNRKNKIPLSLLTISLLCICILIFNKKEVNKSTELIPSKEIQKLDRKLLIDLQTQAIQFTDQALCVLECSNISTQEVTQLFEQKNVVYEKCEKSNCHFTSYTIEGKTINGEEISFKLDTGEDGNEVKELQVQNQVCDCI